MQTFRSELIEGLSAKPKSISPKWLYDAEGSRLFEEITRLDAYYPTRQEITLLKQTMPLWQAHFGADAVLLELGSGASEKTRIVLDIAPTIRAYIPLDISETALLEAADSLKRDYPGLQIRPMLGDFENLPDLPADLPKGRRIGFFPGSTIGNLDNEGARALMRGLRRMLGPECLLILGLDIIKDRRLLENAYDDPEGVTAAFNLNVLERANRELGTDFDTSRFRHRAIWNEARSRIEMHLEARSDMTVSLDDHVFSFREGETLHTENSHKFDREKITALAQGTGWKVMDMRVSGTPNVSLVLLKPA